jgi:hypothetical protein
MFVLRYCAFVAIAVLVFAEESASDPLAQMQASFCASFQRSVALLIVLQSQHP